mgnify:CR=1 FL=1
MGVTIKDISGSTTPVFIGDGRDPVFATGLEAVVRFLLPAFLLNELRPELFTLNPPEVQEQFSDLLGRLAELEGVHVLLSLRDDFLFHCSGQDAFDADAVAAHHQRDLRPVLGQHGSAH